MKHLLRISSLAVALSVSGFALSQSPVGSWNGRVDLSAMKPQNAEQQKVMTRLRTMLPRIKVKLTMRSNGTYTVDFTRGGGRKSDSDNGKWTQAGRTVTIRTNRGKTERMTIAPNGRTMVMLTGAKGAPKGMKIIFTKA